MKSLSALLILSFYAASPAQGHLSIGIRSDGTGAADNRIYKNTLSGVTAGNVANRQNQLDDGLNPPTGLRYECNANSGNEGYDICVAGPSGTPLLGVRAEQGSLALSAGNTFSHLTNVPESDFYNAGVGLKYYQTGLQDLLNSLHPFYKSPSVTTFPITNQFTNDCMANYTFPSESNPNGGGCSTCLTHSGYSSAYTTHKAAQSNYKLQYLSIIDGGNTEARKAMVDTVTNAVRLKDSLGMYAPNLSSTVLDKVARKGLLSDTARYEVMKANAEGVNYEVYDYLKNRLNLPQWMLDSIRAAQQNLTLRSYVLDTLLRHTEQREQANYAVLRLIQEDTAGFNLTSYRSWLDSADGLWARREKVNTYLHEAKYDTALALAARYDTTEIHSTADSIAFKNYRDYVTAYSQWMQTDSSVMRLSSTHLTAAKAIAATDEHKKGSQAARNLLNFFYDSTYFTPAYLPEEQFGKKGNDDEPNTWEANEEQYPKELPTIKLYPNPAKNSVTVQFTGIENDAELIVTNLMGQATQRIHLVESKGKIELNTTDYTNGLYLARIVHKSSSHLKSTFVILK